jgi:hypothetical protein
MPNYFCTHYVKSRWRRARRMMRGLVPAVAVAASTSPLSSQAAFRAPQLEVPDQPACSTCVIRVEHAFALDPDGPAPLPQRVRQVRSKQYWLMEWGELPMLFDEKGTPIGRFGRKGRGPGELTLATDVLQVPGDSTLVLEMAGRASLYGPNGRFARQIGVPWPLGTGLILGWPDRLVLGGNIATPGRVGAPLHLVSFAGNTAELIDSFGPESGELRPGGEPQVRQQITSAKGGGFWTAGYASYHLVRWSADRQRGVTLVRRASYFPEKSSTSLGGPSEAPSPALVAIRESEQGLLWVYVRVAAPTWRAALAGVPQSAREVPVSAVRIDKLFGTVIEVIDPVARKVVARTSIPSLVLSPLSDTTIAVYGARPDGSVGTSVMTTRLQRR